MKYQNFKYIIFILLLSFKVLMANGECSNVEQIAQQLQTKYKTEITQLNINQRLNNNGMICKVNNETSLLILLYDNEMMDEEGIYDLSIVFAEIQNNEIVASTFIPNLSSIDNGIELTDLVINLKDYKKFTNKLNIGIILEKSSSSSVNYFVEKQLFVFEKNKTSFSPILSNYSIYKLSAATNGTCQGEFKILNLENIDYNYPEITFNFSIIDKVVKNSKCEEIIKSQKKSRVKFYFNGIEYRLKGSKKRKEEIAQ